MFSFKSNSAQSPSDETILTILIIVVVFYEAATLCAYIECLFELLFSLCYNADVSFGKCCTFCSGLLVSHRAATKILPMFFLTLINFGLLDHQRERRRFFPNPIHADLWTGVRCFSLSDCCFILSSAASGNIQTVQLLCELKSPVNLKDAVRTFIITSTLVFPDLFFLAALEEALTQNEDHKKCFIQFSFISFSHCYS